VGTNHISGTADRLRRCQFSSPVSVINFSWSLDSCWSHPPWDLYCSAARPNRRNGLITIWWDMGYLACAEPLHRAGLSAAPKTLVWTAVQQLKDFNWHSVLRGPPAIAELLLVVKVCVISSRRNHHTSMNSTNVNLGGHFSLDSVASYQQQD